MITLIENVQSALDNNKFACGLFADLAKAFDELIITYYSVNSTIIGYEVV